MPATSFSGECFARLSASGRVRSFGGERGVQLADADAQLAELGKLRVLPAERLEEVGPAVGLDAYERVGHGNRRFDSARRRDGAEQRRRAREALPGEECAHLQLRVHPVLELADELENDR